MYQSNARVVREKNKIKKHIYIRNGVIHASRASTHGRKRPAGPWIPAEYALPSLEVLERLSRPASRAYPAAVISPGK
jgi:hypothetical protein